MLHPRKLLPLLLVLLLVAVAPAPARDTAPTDIFHKQMQNGAEIYVRNGGDCDVTFTVTADLMNATAEPPLPRTFTVGPHQEIRVAELSPVTRGLPWKYSYDGHFVKGSVTAEHNDKVAYRLPYASGKACRVLQGANGSFSHKGELANAIDWKMRVGTPVLAARDGVVVGVEDHFMTGSRDKSMAARGNYVLIRHDDATIGEYMHLKPGGARVRVGERVGAGHLLGLSGNTGWTTEPHLHFMVFKAVDGLHRASFSIRFQVVGEAEPITLKQGKAYKAP